MLFNLRSFDANVDTFSFNLAKTTLPAGPAYVLEAEASFQGKLVMKDEIVLHENLEVAVDRALAYMTNCMKEIAPGIRVIGNLTDYAKADQVAPGIRLVKTPAPFSIFDDWEDDSKAENDELVEDALSCLEDAGLTQAQLEAIEALIATFRK